MRVGGGEESHRRQCARDGRIRRDEVYRGYYMAARRYEISLRV